MKHLNLFSIGEVSKITGMHIKSLRYYDRTGVFKPAYTDPDSGYRYYSFDQLQNIIAVRTCLDSGITLNKFDQYVNDGAIDYTRLIADAEVNVDQAMELLKKRKTYLDFMKQEIGFNNNADSACGARDCYGSIPLWLTPFDGDIDTFDRKETYLRLAKDAAGSGFQINPLYYGMLMKCSGGERKVYLMAGVEDFLNIKEESGHIFRTPETWYSCVSRPNLDVRAAEKIWPEYFALDYDKVVLATTSLQSNASEPAFSLFINKPPLQ